MTTKSQKMFEDSLLSLYPQWDRRIALAKRSDGEYASMSTHVGWLSYQVGRKQALNEAIALFINTDESMVEQKIKELL
jgi:hypothetical protein